jgi:hypothetical protein
MTVTFDFTIVETALYSRLTNTAGTALWGTRVYVDQAPALATAPYVLFLQAGGGDENENPAGSFDVLYQVECWGTVSVAQTRLGAAYINQAMLGSALTFNGTATAGGTVYGATNFRTQQEDVIRSVENVDGKQFFRRGATYRLRGA